MIGELLEIVGLTEKRDAYVEALSRGMRQRLCLAHTLVHDPALLILDEPASGLDPRARVEMREILRELRSMGKTILVSSHILPELGEMCTGVAIIDHGRLLRSGSIHDIERSLRASALLRIDLLGDEAAVAAARDVARNRSAHRRRPRRRERRRRRRPHRGVVRRHRTRPRPTSSARWWMPATGSSGSARQRAISRRSS